MFEIRPDCPQTLGDLVGLSFRTFRLKVPFFFSVLLWPCVISSASLACVKWCFLQGYTLLHQSLSFETLLIYGGGIMLALSVLALAQWELAIRSLAIVRMVIRHEQDYASSLIYARQKKWSVLLVYNAAVFLPFMVLSFWLGIGIATALMGAQSLALKALSYILMFGEGLLLTVSFSWMILLTSVMFSVLAVEDFKYARLIERSYELTLRYLWRGGSYFCLLGLTLFALALAMYMPLFFLGGFEASRSFAASADHAVYSQPLYLHVLSAVWESLLDIILLAVALVADAFYYNDLCFRYEGQDIMRKLRQLD